MGTKNNKIESIFYGAALAVLLFCWMPNVVSADDTQTPPAAQPATTNTPPASATNVPVTEVEVKAEKEKPPKEGSAEVGYKVENVTTTGPWGEMKIQDTPYSINVIPSDLIENTISRNQDQLFKMNPLTQITAPSDINNISGQVIRGFSVQNYFVDGIRNGNIGLGMFVEDLERIEVYSGLSGFLYGANDVGGTVNYVLKRPTPYYLTNVTVGDYGNTQYFLHGDFGGPIDKDGKFGYRFNIMGQDGKTDIENQRLKKVLATAAFDWHVTDKLLLQVDASYSDYRLDGRQEQFYFPNPLSFMPKAPDNSQLWGPTNTYNEVATTRLGAQTTYHINDIFTFRAAFNNQIDSRQLVAPATGTVLTDDTYSMSILGNRSKDYSYGGYAYVDANFSTFGIEHKLTLGSNGYAFLQKTAPYTTLSATSIISFSNPGSANISVNSYSPDQFPLLKTGKTDNYSYIIGDDIKFSDQWSALAGVNISEIKAENYNTNTGAFTSGYNKSEPSPSASLIYKPTPNITTYATYMDELQQGTIVSSTSNFTNGGQTLAPFVSHQYEVGAKETLGGTLLTAAVFEIDKANTYNQVNANGTQTAMENGREVHRGVEFTTSGKVMQNLTLLGGITLLDAKVTKANTAFASQGNVPDFVARQTAKIYAEYDAPFLKGLTFNGGVYYTGNFYVNPTNTLEAPSVALIDLGARYTTKMYGDKTMTYRIFVANVTNENYWLYGPLGSPRSITFSATMRF